MFIKKIMCLSTAHITTETQARLAYNGLVSEGLHEEIWVTPHDHGWFIYIGEHSLRQTFIPFDLLELLRHAKKHHCAWVKLDHDEPPDPAFKNFSNPTHYPQE